MFLKAGNIFSRRRKTGSMPPSFVSCSVAFVVVGIVTTIPAFVRLGADMHVHYVLLHQGLVHETLLAVFTLVPRLVVADVLVPHVDGQVLHLSPAQVASPPSVPLLLVLRQLVLVPLHLPAVGTLHRLGVVVPLKVASQVLSTLPFKSTKVTNLLVRLQMPLQLDLGLKAALAALLRAGDPAHVHHLHVSLLLRESDRSRRWTTFHVRQPERAWQIWAITGEVLDGVDHFVLLHVLCIDVGATICAKDISVGIHRILFNFSLSAFYITFLPVKGTFVVVHRAGALANVTTFVANKSLVPSCLMVFQLLAGLECFWALGTPMPAHVSCQHMLLHLAEVQILLRL